MFALLQMLLTTDHMVRDPHKTSDLGLIVNLLSPVCDARSLNSLQLMSSF